MLNLDPHNKRPLTLEQAKARYQQRFTMENVPQWAQDPMPNKKYPAPHYATDAEWYERTSFPGENGIHGNSKSCRSMNQTWPLGHHLAEPYRHFNSRIPCVRGN